MKLILGISRDGYTATGPEDDMKWLGTLDKKLFKLLTQSSVNNICGASHNTARFMPRLKNRHVVPLSTNPNFGMTLEAFNAVHNWEAWLLGGPTLAEIALRQGFVDKAFILKSNSKDVPHADPAYRFNLPLTKCMFSINDVITINDVEIQIWSRRG